MDSPVRGGAAIAERDVFRARQWAARPLFLRAASAPYLPAFMVVAAPLRGLDRSSREARARRPTGDAATFPPSASAYAQFAPPANDVRSVIPDPAPLQPCCPQPLPCNPANLSLLFS